MSGKTGAGLVMIVVGVILALWGINLMNSLGQQMAGALGIQDNAGAVAAVGGSLLAIIGLALAVTGVARANKPPAPTAARYATLRSNWATKGVFGALRSLSRGPKPMNRR
jgi:TRAP-type C4-dicarboxylate transport system permease small subunit